MYNVYARIQPNRLQDKKNFIFSVEHAGSDTINFVEFCVIVTDSPIFRNLRKNSVKKLVSSVAVELSLKMINQYI